MFTSDFSELSKTASVGAQGSVWGTGGMATKVKAAQLASTAGIRTAIVHSHNPNAISLILEVIRVIVISVMIHLRGV